jgi:hypothetical protein
MNRSSGLPVWIAMSTANEPVVRSLWATAPGSAITGFQYDARQSPEDRLLVELDTIELHHGPYSVRVPYDELRVIGCALTPRVKDALIELDFSIFEEVPDGFRGPAKVVRFALRGRNSVSKGRSR